MKLAILPVAGYLVGIVTAQPSCKNLTIPVTISARNGNFPESVTPTTNIETTDFFLELARASSNYTDQVVEGYITISGTYNIAATYCQPVNGTADVVQVLTHGVGFARDYWNLPFNNFNYSYTNVAIDTYGFSTFAYDRLGVGESQHGDPLNFVQSWAQMAVLETLSNMLREGSIQEVPQFQKVLHVGHSFGSIETVGVIKTNSTVWDGVALTGFAPKSAVLKGFELASDFGEANAVNSSYPLGYFVPGGTAALHEALLAPNEFNSSLLAYLAATGSPPAVGEFLTLNAGDAAGGPPTEFTGPVIVVTGQNDLPFCAGNCYRPFGNYSTLPDASQRLFPQAKVYKTVIVPNSGHGLNLQYSHPFTYAQINEFFIQNGLGP